MQPGCVVHVPIKDATFGPRDASSGQLLPLDTVWRDAVAACAPSMLWMVEAVGGLAMLGVTASEVQAQLAALGDPLWSSTPTDGAYAGTDCMCARVSVCARHTCRLS